MNCRGVSRRLSAYIDQDLSPGIRQAVDEHLQTCIICKRKLNEFEAIVAAARNLAPLTISGKFESRVMEAVKSRRETHEILTGLRYRLTLAGVAFMVTSAAIFFVVGPPSSTIPTGYTTSPIGPVPETNAPDFVAHPEIRVPNFPVPVGTESTALSQTQVFTPSDSIRPDVIIQSNIQKVNENVSGKDLR